MIFFSGMILASKYYADMDAKDVLLKQKDQELENTKKNHLGRQRLIFDTQASLTIGANLYVCYYALSEFKLALEQQIERHKQELEAKNEEIAKEREEIQLLKGELY